MDKYQKRQVDWYNDIQTEGIDWVLDAIESMDESYESYRQAELAVAQHVQDIEDNLRVQKRKVWLRKTCTILAAGMVTLFVIGQLF